MVATIDKEHVSKLPKWAQEHIKNIQMERDAAVRQLNEFVDSQKDSAVWVEEHICTGEQKGPSTKRQYIHSKTVTFEVSKGREIDVSLKESESKLKIMCSFGKLAILPSVSNSVDVVIVDFNK